MRTIVLVMGAYITVNLKEVLIYVSRISTVSNVILYSLHLSVTVQYNRDVLEH